MLGGVITSIWLCFGVFEVKGDHVGTIIALAGSAAFLVMAIRRKDPALFAFGALAALFAGPATVQVDLTDACNQNCIVCWLPMSVFCT